MSQELLWPSMAAIPRHNRCRLYMSTCWTRSSQVGGAVKLLSALLALAGFRFLEVGFEAIIQNVSSWRRASRELIAIVI
jgi:hypothetical protein